MKIDMERKLKDPKGADFADGATVGMAAYNALVAPLPSDQQGGSQDQSLKRYRLIQTIAKGGEQEITAEDVVEIKKRAAVALSILAFGALVDALEQRAEVVGINDQKQAESAA